MYGDNDKDRIINDQNSDSGFNDKDINAFEEELKNDASEKSTENISCFSSAENADNINSSVSDSIYEEKPAYEEETINNISAQEQSEIHAASPYMAEEHAEEKHSSSRIEQIKIDHIHNDGPNHRMKDENYGYSAGLNGNENRYRSSENYNTPKWQPDPEKYNTNPKPPVQKKDSTKKWVVPLVIVLAVMVAVIVVGLVLGSNYIDKAVKQSIQSTEQSVTGTKEITVNEETVADADGAVAEETETSGVTWTDASNDVDAGGIVITDVSDIVDEVFPAVVSITSRKIIDDSNYFDFFFGRQSSPYGNSGNSSREVDAGIGSGTIVGNNGDELLILTSNHVVEGSSSLVVTFVNGTSIDGVIKSASDETDIAIVSVKLDDIDEETMSEIRMATLSTRPAEMGEGVIVIGNAMGYGMSVTTGIVSATERQLTVEGKTINVIQTDAAINSGNSGGCMLNSKGEVIGISEAKIVVTGVEGMCYAIPVSTNSELIQNLIEEETPEVEENETGYATGAYIGIRGRDITTELAGAYDMPEGVYVSSVVTGGGAEAAGIKAGDIITAMDDTDVTTMSKLQYELAKHNDGDVVKITVMRENGGKYEQEQFEVTLTGLLS